MDHPKPRKFERLPTYSQATAQGDFNHRLPSYSSFHVRRYHPYPRPPPPRLVDFYFNTIYDDERIELDLRPLGVRPAAVAALDVENRDREVAEAEAAARLREEATNERIHRLSILVVDFVDGVKNAFMEAAV